jgi:hypothetical protein
MNREVLVTSRSPRSHNPIGRDSERLTERSIPLRPVSDQTATGASEDRATRMRSVASGGSSAVGRRGTPTGSP